MVSKPRRRGGRLRLGERDKANYSYTYGAPAPDSDRGATRGRSPTTGAHWAWKSVWSKALHTWCTAAAVPLRGLPLDRSGQVLHRRRVPLRPGDAAELRKQDTLTNCSQISSHLREGHVVRAATYTRVAVGVTLCIAAISASGCAGAGFLVEPYQARDALVIDVVENSRKTGCDGKDGIAIRALRSATAAGRRRARQLHVRLRCPGSRRRSRRPTRSNRRLLDVSRYAGASRRFPCVRRSTRQVGPVEGLSLLDRSRDYYIAGTSLCVPGDAAEIRKQDNG